MSRVTLVTITNNHFFQGKIQGGAGRGIGIYPVPREVFNNDPVQRHLQRRSTVVQAEALMMRVADAPQAQAVNIKHQISAPRIKRNIQQWAGRRTQKRSRWLATLYREVGIPAALQGYPFEIRKKDSEIAIVAAGRELDNQVIFSRIVQYRSRVAAGVPHRATGPGGTGAASNMIVHAPGRQGRQ